MTIREMLAGCDDAVLEALTSPGILRRARKAEIGTVAANQNGGFTVLVGSHTVEVDGRGPQQARCDCPATGTCLHIVAAVISLRNAQHPGTEAAASSPGADLLALTTDEIVAFAGEALHAAQQLARSEPLAEIAGTDASVSVRFSGVDHAVIFPSGSSPLAKALWKGPRSRRSLVVAAAALAFRASQGQNDIGLSPPAGQQRLLQEADLQDLSAVMRGIEAAVGPVLTGSAAIATEHLFDLTLSARVASLPRLASELRALTHQAGLADAHDRGFRPERFLVAAARCHALAYALRQTPDRSDLTGIYRRSYDPAPPLSLMSCGARVWHNPAGGRGLRVFLYDFENRRWIIAGPARAEGADPAFDPHKAYGMPLLGASSIRGLMGKTIRLSRPRLSADLHLAPDASGQLQPGATGDLPAAHTLWDEARREARRALDSGLHRGSASAPLLLKPARVEAPVQDPLSGLYRLPLRDAAGILLELQLPPRARAAADLLASVATDTLRLLAEAEVQDGELTAILVSVAFGDETLDIFNPALDPLPELPKPTVARRMAELGRTLVPSLAGRSAARDPVADLARKALVAATGMAAGAAPASSLISQADLLGLPDLADALRAAPSAGAALRCAYVASELRWACEGGGTSASPA